MATPKLRFKEFDGDWLLKSINDISTKVGSGSTPRGGSEAYVDEGIIFIRSQNVNDNQLILDDVAYIPESTHAKMSGSKVLPNDILLNITGASIGRSCVVPETFSEGNVNQHVCIIRTPNDDPIFVQSFLSSENGQNHIQSKQVGGGREGLNFQAIRSIDFEMPSKEEQTKIASFLSVVDEKIIQLMQKHELLSQYKQGMMQKLFSQQIRFKADDGSEFGEWKNLKFKTFIEERSKICSNSEVELCSLTIEKGVTEKTERYTRDFLVKDESNAYKEVHFNDFVMNPMNLRFGAIAKSNIKKLVKISKYYNVFYINEDIVHLDYFTSFAISKPMIDFYNLMSTGSLIEKRRNHFKDFIEYEKLFPCLEEQTKIANFLSAIDQKIDKVAQQIEETKQWKKGLLQQMFV
ncbi:restriction endonuclease subunit S [Acinetobacter schindleri]|nr:restriction endonuclease subunit S [Acinetobacter schindleri]QIC64395.1 restriction endonuclease subunit S [Acinetobacter schindleri]